MAEVLGKSYDDLVSVSLDSSMFHLESALNSGMLRQFPFDEFGFEAGDLLNLLTRVPDKSSALLHALIGIGRQYDLQEEDFLQAALRSYQELHDNYFPELEAAAEDFAAGRNLRPGGLTTTDALAAILHDAYGYQIDHRTLSDDPDLFNCRVAYLPGATPRLLINSRLNPNQVKFLLARELGYQCLHLTDRSPTSMPLQVDSFEQILNDFKAAYFGGALLMPRQQIVDDLTAFFAQPSWQPEQLADMLTRYDVTPEMLLYRWSELVPQFFGFKLHFLRFHQEGDEIRPIKQFNMNMLLVPSGVGLNEHTCRRWLPIRLLRELRTQAGADREQPMIGAQISEMMQSKVRFLNFGFARSLVLSPDVNSCVSMGFAIDAEVKQTVRFLEDLKIPVVQINETCERCPLKEGQCKVRAAPPTVLRQRERSVARRLALSRLGERTKKKP
jgi:hypothetical protein